MWAVLDDLLKVKVLCSHQAAHLSTPHLCSVGATAIIWLFKPVLFFLLPSFVASGESQGPRPVRDQGESAGWAGQQVTTGTKTRRTPRCPVCMEDQSHFLRELLSQQTRWDQGQLRDLWWCEAFAIIYEGFFSSDRVYAQKSGTFWFLTAPQTTPESFKRNLLRTSVPAWWETNWLCCRCLTYGWKNLRVSRLRLIFCV